jgi:hypothetical protein
VEAKRNRGSLRVANFASWGLACLCDKRKKMDALDALGRVRGGEEIVPLSSQCGKKKRGVRKCTSSFDSSWPLP